MDRSLFVIASLVLSILQNTHATFVVEEGGIKVINYNNVAFSKEMLYSLIKHTIHVSSNPTSGYVPTGSKNQVPRWIRHGISKFWITQIWRSHHG